MESELRLRFHQALADIDTNVVRLFGFVSESTAAATESFLAGDTAAARDVAGRDAVVDRLERELEELVERQLLLESPMASELRYLVTVLRIVPQLERCADLAEHVAQRAITGLGTRLTPGLRGQLGEMGTLTASMWQDTANAWVERDGDAATQIDQKDDDLDRLHDELTADLVTAGLDPADLVQTALVARFYERLGDHAVHIAERICYLVTGRPAERPGESAPGRDAPTPGT